MKAPKDLSAYEHLEAPELKEHSSGSTPSTGSGAEVQRALLVAGQLAGIAHQLDADGLERWLNTNPKEFNYETWCRAAIAFKRAIALPPNSDYTNQK
jgi:hypothetical protein